MYTLKIYIIEIIKALTSMENDWKKKTWKILVILVALSKNIRIKTVIGTYVSNLLGNSEYKWL